MNNKPSEFDVHVGHAHVRVRANDVGEAIRVARRQLCEDLPRMWDVISQLPDERFKVQLVDQNVQENEEAEDGRNVA